MEKLIKILVFFLLTQTHMSVFAANQAQAEKVDTIALLKHAGIEAFFSFPSSDEIFLGGKIKKEKLLTADSISARVQFPTDYRPLELKYYTQQFQMVFFNPKTGETIELVSNSGKITNEMKAQIKKNGSRRFYVNSIVVLGQDGYKRKLPIIEVIPK